MSCTALRRVLCFSALALLLAGCGTPEGWARHDATRLTLGMSADQVRETLGEPGWVLEDPGHPEGERWAYRYEEDNVADVVAAATTWPLAIPLCVVAILETGLLYAVTFGIVRDGGPLMMAFEGLIDVYVPEKPLNLQVHFEEGVVRALSLNHFASKKRGVELLEPTPAGR